MHRPEVDERPLRQPSAGDRRGIGRVGGREAVDHHDRRRRAPPARRAGRPGPPAIENSARAARGIDPDQAEPVPRVHDPMPVRQVGLRPGGVRRRPGSSPARPQEADRRGHRVGPDRGPRRTCPRARPRPAPGTAHPSPGRRSRPGRPAAARRTPIAAGTRQPAGVGLAHQGPADQVVERVDAAGRAASDRVVVAIRPVAGDRQEVAVVAEPVVPRRDGRDVALDPSGEPPRLGERQDVPDNARVRSAARVRPAPTEPGSSRTSGWKSPGGQRHGPGEHRAVGRAEDQARRRARPARRRSRSPGRSSSSGRDGGDQPRATAPTAAIHRSSRLRATGPARPEVGEPGVAPGGIPHHPRRPERPEERQGPRRLVDQDREEMPVVPGGDRLEEGGDVGHQADLVDHHAAADPARPLPGLGRLAERRQPRDRPRPPARSGTRRDVFPRSPARRASPSARHPAQECPQRTAVITSLRRR